MSATTLSLFNILSIKVLGCESTATIAYQRSAQVAGHLAKMVSLKKVILKHNPNYQASGPKSYVYLLRKYGFTPTLPGPYQRHSQLHQSGKFQAGQHHVGGKARVTEKLVKQSSDGTTGEV